MATAAVEAPWRNRIVGQADVDPATLVPNPQNWRVHPDRQREALRGTLGAVGWVQQVLVNRTTGRMIDGHARVEEALASGAPSVPVLYVELSEDEERLVLATLDPLSAMADTDGAKLEALLGEISVDDTRLVQFLARLAPGATKGGLTDPDDAPDLRDPRVVPGELWAMGEHRILCGDAADPAVYARLMAGEAEQLLATDPPYGVSYSTIIDGRGNQKAGGWRPINGDDLRGERLYALMAATFAPVQARTAQKPVELYLIPLRNHTEPGEIIYDPFAGSGSAVIAAQESGRRARVVELDPRYAQVIIDRWEAFTGGKAERLDG